MQQRQNSRPGQRRDNLKVFNKSQKSYLPKATALSNSDKSKPVPGGTGQNYDESGNRLVTSSLGQNSDRKPVNYKNGGDGKSSLKSNSKQVWRGSSGNGAKMSSDKGRFVKYLPQDDAVAAGLGVEDGGLNPEETQGVADLLNQELRALLGMKAREFWRTDTQFHDSGLDELEGATDPKKSLLEARQLVSLLLNNHLRRLFKGRAFPCFCRFWKEGVLL